MENNPFVIIMPESSRNKAKNISNEDFWIYKLKNHPDCQPQKEELFRMLNFLDSPENPGFYLNHLEKQTQENQQTHTYNEFALGYLLKSNGYILEYERKIEHGSKSKTPDWYVIESDTNPEFIVEAFTTHSRSDEKIQAENRQVKLFKRRLEKIKYDAVIEIKVDTKNLNDQTSKKIAVKIESILNSDRELIENFHYEDRELDFGYEIKKTKNGSSQLVPIISENFAKIDARRFFEKISEKRKKYSKCSIPLIIAPFVDMGIGQKVLKTPLIFDYLKNNLDISAILWLDRVHPFVDGWTVNIVYNTKSRAKLNNIFKDEENISIDFDITYNQVLPKKVMSPSLMYDCVQENLKKLKEYRRFELHNQANIEMHCHWNNPISTRFEYVDLI